MNSIILGCVSMIPYALSGILVNKVGKKVLIISASLLSIVATLWLRWSSSRIENVGLFAADMALGQTIMSLLQSTTIEVFPTSIRYVYCVMYIVLNLLMHKSTTKTCSYITLLYCTKKQFIKFCQLLPSRFFFRFNDVKLTKKRIDHH